MAANKEKAAALKLAEKLCVRPTSGQAVKQAQSCLIWCSLISHLRATVTTKRRRIHIKSHSDCFLGSEAVDVVVEHLKHTKEFKEADVTRDKVVCVCQALLDCNVFEVVGTKSFGKDKLMFQDSKGSLYRFMGVHSPFIDELERGVLTDGIEAFFCITPSNKQEDEMVPSTSHGQMPCPVKFVSTNQDAPATDGLSLEVPVDSLSPSPSRGRTELQMPQSLVDEVWQEQTLLRLLNLVELPLLEGVLQCIQNPPTPQKPHQLLHSNPDLIYSSNHLDREILHAFRDSQEDEWLCAALDCLDFLPDQSVVELSREWPHCFPEDPTGIQRLTYEQPLLSSSALATCKLLVYGTLVKHYNHGDRAPLMPHHMTDIYRAITDHLVTAKLGNALEALQLSLKLLPPSNREELRRLLTFMALAAEPQGIKLEKELENRLAVKRSFSRAVLPGKALSKEEKDLLVVFMLSNIKEIFKIPGALHKEVSDKLANLAQGQQPDVTGSSFCQQVSSSTYVDSTKTCTNNELWKLLDSIHSNTKMSSKEKKRLLGQFYQAHPELSTSILVTAVSILN